MAIAFVGIWLLSKLDAASGREAEVASFDAQYRAVRDRHRRRLRPYPLSAAPAGRQPMPSGFDASNPPFDRLDAAGDRRLRAALDIGYFRPGEVIAAARPGGRQACTSSSRARSRCARRRRSTPCSARRTASTAAPWCMARRARISSRAEETLCYLVPAEVIRALVGAQPGLRRLLLFRGLRQARRLRPRPRAEGVESVLRARVREASRGPAITVDGATRPGEGRPSHARGQHQRAVRARRRPHRRRHRHEPRQGGGAAAPAAGDAGPRSLSLRRDRGGGG